MDNLRELEYFHSLYPGKMKQLQQYVIAACDQIDYDHSPMYDEYPDRTMVDQMCTFICRNIMEDPQSQGDFSRLLTGSDRMTAEIQEEEEVEIYELTQMQQFPGWGPPQGRPPHGRPPSGPPPWGPPPGRPPHGRPPSGPPPWGPPPGRPPHGRPPHRPPHNPGWLDDIVRLLFLHEMHRRRCQRGICR